MMLGGVKDRKKRRQEEMKMAGWHLISVEA